VQETYKDTLLGDTNRLVIELTKSRAFRKKLPEVLKTISAHLKTEQSYLLEVRPVKGMLDQLVYKKIIEVSAAGEKKEHIVHELFSEVIFSQRVLKSWLTDLASLSKTKLSIGQSSENNNLPSLIFADHDEEAALDKLNNNQICRKIFNSLGVSISSFLIVPLDYEQAILGFFATHSSNVIVHTEHQLEMVVSLMQLTANLYAC